MKDHMNSAHKAALELLRTVDEICVQNQITYTIAADTLLYYAEALPYYESIPIIYIALLYPDYCRLKKRLHQFCSDHQGYSLHDHRNTRQFETLDFWFVKHSRVKLDEQRHNEEFYYGTRLVATPLFYAGGTKKQWLVTYKRYRLEMGALNAQAVLAKKPLHSYLKLSKKRIITNYLRRRRNEFSIEKLEKELGAKPASEYILYPFMVRRDSKNPNSLPWVVKKDSAKATVQVWQNVKRVELAGVGCYAVADYETVLESFPHYYIKEVTWKQKSQLLLNGGEDLRRIQLVQTELLTEFDRICRKNNLRYNLGFGTLLGAARHKGFIPWDDDIDVTMPWEDYVKLDEAIKQDLDGELYYYRTPDNEEHNHLIFKHLERRGTLYTKPGRNKLTQQIGVFIDIFPMYPAAPNAFLDWFHAKVCRFWRTALWATVGWESEKAPLKRFYYKQIAGFGNKKCYENFVKSAIFFSNKKGRLKFWIAMDRNPYNVALVEADNFNHTVELDFEGRKYYAPENYEKVLDYCFGLDWRLYPGTESRTALHQAMVEIGDLYDFESEGKE